LVLAQEQPAAPPPQEQTDAPPQLSAADIDTLIAPIALYPDPLISQILPAATYPDDIQAAAAWLQQNPNNPTGIDAQAWDLSVKSVAHYPQLIEKLAGDMDWTLALGQAYTLQQDDVMQSVQRLRQLAQNAGTLQSTPQQNVVMEQEAIRIVPAEPQVIYVPRYDPEVVYVAGPAYRPGLMAFGAGLFIGSWLNSDLDWRTHRVYYHGWVGSGWIASSQPYVRVNRIYVNDSFRSRAWVNPAYRSRPVVVNRTYVTRHENRYQFNRNRPVNAVRGTTVHRPTTAIERINAARENRGTTRTTTTESHGRGVTSTTTTPHRERTTTTTTTPYHERTTTTTTTTPHRERTTTTTTAPHHEKTTATTTTTSGSHGSHTTTTKTTRPADKKKD
jgi:hypothetical protein